MSCLSVPARCSRGWSFWAKDDSAKFISPSDKEYDFTLQDGLYKLNKQQTVMQTEDPDVTYMREVWMNKSNKKAKRQSRDINPPSPPFEVRYLNVADARAPLCLLARAKG